MIPRIAYDFNLYQDFFLNSEALIMEKIINVFFVIISISY